MTTNTEQKQSLLSSIPKDISNIIKEFNLEKREQCPLKINWCITNYYITKYKEGYKIDKVLSIKRFKRDRNTDNDEEKEILLNKIQKKNKKYYPIFIDEVDDVIQHMYNLFYNEYNTEDEEADPDNTGTTILNISGCITYCNVIDFERKMRLYMKMIGKAYKRS